MIFRMTVNDNDFTGIVEKFADNFFDRVYWSKHPEGMSATEWYEKLYKPKERVRELIHLNEASNLTDEDKVILRATVYLEWCDYIDSLPTDNEIDSKIKDSLKKDFDVSVGFDFTDKWENGEVVYYFTTNQKWISQ